MKQILIVAIVSMSCATQIKAVSEIAQPVEQSVIQPDPTIPKDLGAGEYLELGFMFHNQGRYKLATDAFNAAIGTQYLNNAGRALAYWHIADCGLNLHNFDQTAEAYFSFIIIAQDILYDDRVYASAPGNDFAKQFQLQDKLTSAKAFMNIIWSARTGDYGKSMARPIVVKTMDDVEAIATVVTYFCKSRCAVHRLALQEGDTLRVPHTEKILLVHIDERIVDTFFVEMIGENNEQKSVH